MADVRLDDRALQAKLRSALDTACRKGAAGLAGHLQVKLNKSARVGTPGSEAARKRAAKKAGRRAARYLWQPSAPGSPPHKRTGTLQKSVSFETSWMNLGEAVFLVRVGSNVPYARFLEYGTRKMAARPWLRPGLREYLPTFQRIVMAELRRQMVTPGGGAPGPSPAPAPATPRPGFGARVRTAIGRIFGRFRGRGT